MTSRALTAIIVDDEPNVLRGYQRALRQAIPIEVANSGVEALDRIRAQGEYAVIVSDMRMPNMTGLQLLQHVRQLSPDTVRIMLTGNSDQKTAIDAVNEGDVFRFLTKPCEPRMLARAILAGFEQYKLMRMERELLGETLTGAVHALGEMLSMVNPGAGGRIARIEKVMADLVARMGVEMDWRLQLLPTLSQLGSVALPDEICRKGPIGGLLSDEEQATYARFPEVGARMVQSIPRLEDVGRCIRYQLKSYDGGGTPEGDVKGDQIPFGARLLRVACDYDAITLGGVEAVAAACQMRDARPICYDPAIVSALVSYTDSLASLRRTCIRIDELNDSMTLANDVLLRNGALLIARGQPMTAAVRERLQSFCRSELIDERVEVIVSDPSSATEAAPVAIRAN